MEDGPEDHEICAALISHFRFLECVGGYSDQHMRPKRGTDHFNSQRTCRQMHTGSDACGDVGAVIDHYTGASATD